MESCLFWSNHNNGFNCYDECPMRSENDDEVCVFQECLKHIKLFYKDLSYKEHENN